MRAVFSGQPSDMGLLAWLAVLLCYSAKLPTDETR
jgi:hypothetical protein